jgi:hypothetical protein
MMVALLKARSRVQEYYEEDFIDLGDFCHQLLHIMKSDEQDFAEVRDVCKKLRNSIGFMGGHDQANPQEGSYVYAFGYYGHPVERSHGVSIYFPFEPRKETINRYQQRLKFTVLPSSETPQSAGAGSKNNSTWAGFLDTFFPPEDDAAPSLSPPDVTGPDGKIRDTEPPKEGSGSPILVPIRRREQW